MVMKGQEIVLTHYGADRYRKVDQGIGDPGALCLPWGPIRGMIIPHPFAILQNSSVIAVLIESQRTYRPIYMDGRGHPADLKEHPEWMGHSIGKWEGDTLVVDTTGVDNRTWLDTSGFEHSDKLHITERYLKTGPDTIKWDVTFEDPVFFAKPSTAEWIFQRSTGDRIISHSCVEFEHDVKDMVPGILIGGSGKAKEEDGAEVVTPLNRPGASLVLRAGLVTLNRMMGQNESTDATLKRACDILQRAFGFQRVSIYSALAQSQAFSVRAISGKPCQANADTQCLHGIAKDGVVREALLKNANLYIRSSSDDALGQSWERWFSLFPDAKSFFLAPIVHDNALLGVIYADYSRSNEQGWTSEELEAVEAIKRVVRLALQAERTMHSPSSE
jgi:hypothetical protein